MLVKSSGKSGFSLELIDSDVENIRVAVQSTEPVAPPTVPKQATPPIHRHRRQRLRPPRRCRTARTG